jgi:hypothetical protein
LFKGKFGQKPEKYTHTMYFKSTEQKAFMEFISRRDLEISGLFAINEELIMVNYRNFDEFQESIPTASIPIASLVTSLARYKLYQFIDQIKPESVLYTDTGDIIISLINVSLSSPLSFRLCCLFVARGRSEAGNE